MHVRERTGSFTAITFPASDAVFAERVREILAARTGTGVGEAIEALTGRLRPIHPDVSASVRQDIAGFGDESAVYVYRDGSAYSKFGGVDWVDEPTTARLITDASGTYIAANQAAAALLGVATDEIIGRRAGTFTRPDARVTDAEALWHALSTTGRLHSLAVVCRGDGVDVPVEFVTMRDGDGPGRNVTALRPVG